ncbi:Hsp33 family molecular chaperone HslO [Methyloradius palustris]|uniref:33 kDa chaperonin n=1 Tax=Methyloradius palustris TaxID=2778876 RepID=A0A8D5FZU3_9PROT|nr:Hsp33 family molecular chaperone HslO [Methyloradius palustris]BCM24755.1 33 kDa chaperonin [Methyloradius palustris]
MPKTDQLHRFVFENTPVRGNTVHLNKTFAAALQHHDYPPILRQALGELMAASALLAATLKLEGGALVVQIQGKGPVSLLVVECTAELTLRATAKWSGELDDLSFAELVGDGYFVITLDPKNGEQSYQGIVPLEGDSISEILENYMHRSEQIETRIWLSCDQSNAAGLLLQKLPDQPTHDQDAWNRACILAETLSNDELLATDAETLLLKLFHQEDIRLFDAKAIAFKCSCSRNSVSNMLRMLGEEEINSILSEHGKIEVNCDFCNAYYAFDKVDAALLLKADVVPEAPKTQH